MFELKITTSQLNSNYGRRLVIYLIIILGASCANNRDKEVTRNDTPSDTVDAQLSNSDQILKIDSKTPNIYNICTTIGRLYKTEKAIRIDSAANSDDLKSKYPSVIHGKLITGIDKILSMSKL